MTTIKKGDPIMEGIKDKKKPSLGFVLLTIGTLVAFIGIGIGVFQLQMIFLLFFSWLLLLPFAMYLGYTADEVEGFAYGMIKTGLQVCAILFAVGALIAVWISAGTVPSIIYFCLKIINPHLVLVIAMVLCTLTALATGTSWGTVGTAGVAMMGVGIGMGIPAPVIAGAVISGTYFGDKMSPVSDSVLLNSTLAGCTPMQHIRHMAYSAGPAYLISAAVYLIMGFTIAGSSSGEAQTQAIITNLGQTFHIGVLTLIPAVVVITLLAMKKSALWSLMLGALAGALVTILYQGYSISEVGAFLVSGFTIDTGDASLNNLLSRGGIVSMLDMVGIVIGALGVGGILKGCGVVDVLVEIISSRVSSSRGIALCAMLACLICIVLIPDNNFSMIMVGTLMAPLFRKVGLRPENLSRISEDVNTLGAVFVPWNVGAVFVASTLGVNIFSAMPFAFASTLTLVINLIFALSGWTMTKYTQAELGQLARESVN
ncbi:putative Malate-2H(+)/Na(+)-lactate antiporter [uncultured Eubacteriales bacterium]|uniref:Putative Malate-2H(+)/Na(+)-lactate antiporter n=1 Tax=uncultured Eubacteriales bacterium TaxID=172733 RepID=A0A212JH54_9FIRM|nr:putative Malate-2H(+)/Na(+)-lactate antiporter [uncultured Eubacteriales bacterium]